MDSTLIAHAVDAARAAGDAILPSYRRAIEVDHKADGSPLTQADRAAHDAVAARLAPSGIPVVSEEGTDLLLSLSVYWLVDPLDGTKDFLAGDDEFTVNVALVEDDRPVLGVVYAPALDELWVGGEDVPTWGVRAGVGLVASQARRSAQARVAVSRFHDHPDVAVFAQANCASTCVPLGSALKYCRLAVGEVDVFPRLVGSSEWDTAAGQALVEAAGGRIVTLNNSPFVYGKPQLRVIL